MDIELNNQLLLNIAENYLLIDPNSVDLSKVRNLDKKFSSSESVRGEDLWRLGEETADAMDLLLDWWYVSDRFAKYAHVQYDKKSAEIYINEATNGLGKCGLKATADAMRAFVDRHPHYVEAKNLRDAWAALRDWCYQKREIYREKHMFVKKRLDQELKMR